LAFIIKEQRKFGILTYFYGFISTAIIYAFIGLKEYERKWS